MIFLDSIRNLEILKENLNSESCLKNKPLVDMGEGEAPGLDYNLPQSSSFSTYGSIKMSVPESFFSSKCFEVPENSVLNQSPELVAQQFSESVQLGVNDFAPALNAKRLRRNLKTGAEELMQVATLSVPEGDLKGKGEDGGQPLVVMKETCFNEVQLKQLLASRRIPVAVKKLNGYGTEVRLVTPPTDPIPGLFVIEEYKTTSFLGKYGAGKALQTFSLLPGEKTTITVKTYKNSTATRSQAENLLDSFSQSSVDEMESLMEEENSASSEKSASVSASVSGVLSCLPLSIGVSGGYSSSRSSNSRALNRALGKHCEQSNSARNVEINTSSTETVEEGEEHTTVREIENVNKSRVLNFVFRQLLQEYVSITYLANIRIAYSNGYPESTRVVDIEDIDNLLADVIDKDEFRNEVKNQIWENYAQVMNYKKKPEDCVQFLEEVQSPAGNKDVFWTCRATDKYIHVDDKEFVVPGVILQVQVNTLRTDSVIADALMGQGEALDCFNQRAQNAVAIGEYLKNLEQIQKIELIRSIDDPALRAELIKSVYGTSFETPHANTIGSQS